MAAPANVPGRCLASSSILRGEAPRWIPSLGHSPPQLASRRPEEEGGGVRPTTPVLHSRILLDQQQRGKRQQQQRQRQLPARPPSANRRTSTWPWTSFPRTTDLMTPIRLWVDLWSFQKENKPERSDEALTSPSRSDRRHVSLSRALSTSEQRKGASGHRENTGWGAK